MRSKRQKARTIKDINTPAFRISTGITLIAHIVAFWGLKSSSPNFFRDSSIYNLLLIFLFMMWNEYKIGSRYVTSLLVAFSVGLLFEVIGLNTNIFESRIQYSDLLGLKVFHVPLIIGLNWFKIIYCSYVGSIFLSQLISEHTKGTLQSAFQKPLVYAIVAAFITVLFEYLMEPLALKLGYWKWQNNEVPDLRYLYLFITSFILARVFYTIRLPHTNGFTLAILAIQMLFFILGGLFL